MKTVQYHQAQSAYNLRCKPIYQHSARLTCWNTVKGAIIYNILYFTGCKITSYRTALPCIAMNANRTFSIANKSCSLCLLSKVNLKCNVLVPPKMQTHTHPILTLLYVNLMEMCLTCTNTLWSQGLLHTEGKYLTKVLHVYFGICKYCVEENTLYIIQLYLL